MELVILDPPNLNRNWRFAWSESGYNRNQSLRAAARALLRSPKINDKSGRDHWEHCYSALLAGGGVQGGRVVGSSDKHAGHPHDNPVSPADVSATIHHCVGTSTEQAATLGIGVNNGKVIEELF